MKLEDWLECDVYERMETGAGAIAVSKKMPLVHKMAVRLFGTGYEVGALTLHLPDEAAEEGPPQAKYVDCPVTLVMHPTRGVLSVGVLDCEDDPHRPLRALRERLETTCERLRERLVNGAANGGQHAFWSRRPLPIGPAILRGPSVPPLDPAAAGVDPSIIVDVDWAELPQRFGRVMDHQNPSRRPMLARDLATAIKTLNHNYTDHVDFIGTWGFVVAQLFERRCGAGECAA